MTIISELEAAERLCEKGPWHLYREGIDPYQNGGLVGPDDEIWGGYDFTMPDDETIDFIAKARNALPDLLHDWLYMRSILAKATSIVLDGDADTTGADVLERLRCKP